MAVENLDLIFCMFIYAVSKGVGKGAKSLNGPILSSTEVVTCNSCYI